MKIELLSPAKNLAYGREAINHGADAVYIGAPSYGARAAATNTIEDIENLVQYAHLYGCKVFTTVNTLLFDSELESAVAMIHRLYESGVDALIIQDLGLLECDLPPIELHASTQCHNNTVDRVKFMESIGMKRVILARETTLEQMKVIRNATHVDLEAFVHGALCVSYSGQCYLSQYLSQRSGNRGECSQPCRGRYDLLDGEGREILSNRHFLSLKDLNAAQHIRAMIDAGISSFKIEGRLKDMSYLKNITSYYRKQLDAYMDGHEPSSSGKTIISFNPDPFRTFNRGYTDYFLERRQPMASLMTQKSIGKQVGRVLSVDSKCFTVDGDEVFARGDGLCFFDDTNTLQGFLINEVRGKRLTPNRMPDLRPGTVLWRNHDHRFENILQGHTSERRIDVVLTFNSTQYGFSLAIRDSDGLEAVSQLKCEKNNSNNPSRTAVQIKEQLSKLGNTPFHAVNITDKTHGAYFLTPATLNSMRREAVDALINLRIEHFTIQPSPIIEKNPTLFPERELDYRANVVNEKACRFYQRHGAVVVERGVEQTHDYSGKALMTSKYCIRFELGCCKKGKDKGFVNSSVSIAPNTSLMLRNNNRLLKLEFDCDKCLMYVKPVN